MASRHCQSTRGNHSEYHDWSSSARRVRTPADERFVGLLQRISGQIDEVSVNDVLEYRRTRDLSSTDMDWLNSELYPLLSIKTSGTAMASIKSLEEVEVKGFIGWQRLDREARGYHRHRVALPSSLSTCRFCKTRNFEDLGVYVTKI